MAGQNGKRRADGKPAQAGGRRTMRFVRAGAMIDGQMNTVTRRKGYALARLRALWPEIAGPDMAGICQPAKLALARGPAGGLLTLAVAGAHAPRVQMQVPALRDRINQALGTGTVGRIQLRHMGGFAEAPAAYRAEPPEPLRHDETALPEPISSIGDPELRAALAKLARNVLSRPKSR